MDKELTLAEMARRTGEPAARLRRWREMGLEECLRRYVAAPEKYGP